MVTAFLGLGSNLGHRLALLRGGRDRLAAPGLIVELSSPLYETAAQGGPVGSPPFLNAVLQVRTSLTARQLLAHALAVETALGRTRPAPNAPRTLDIDLLLYGAEVIDEPGLRVPHPRLAGRNFVLYPLRELAPELIPPGLSQTISALVEALPPGSALTPLRTSW
jgi:2-amino-4-hydroxy-6-hydroxymethyldihydropteridine diphosphokinase